MQGTKNLTSGPILKQLFTLAMPIMATSFIQMAYSLTDMAWLGRLSSEAVAAVGAVGILLWMSGSIAMLNKVGMEVSVGQSIGMQDEHRARKYASHNITISLLISLLWSVGLFALASPIVDIYKLESSISVTAVTYLRTVTTAIPFAFMSMAFTGLFNAAGRSKTPFYINGLGLILNMILDPLFIFVLGWETQGAAYATCISQIAVFMLFIYQLKVKKVLFPGLPFLVRLQRKCTFHIFRLGTPVAALNTLFAVINMSMCRIASEQGAHIGLMVFTTVGQIEAITWNTSQGFSTALSAFVAQNYASGKTERVMKAYRTTLWMTLVFGSMCSYFFIFHGGDIFSLFIPDPAALQPGSDYLRIDGYSQLFMMLEITTQGLFYGMGRTIPPAVISIGYNYLRIPLSLFFISCGWGLAGIWWAVSISSVLKGVTSAIWFAVTRKKGVKE